MSEERERGLRELDVFKICAATRGVPMDHNKGDECPRCHAIEKALAAANPGQGAQTPENLAQKFHELYEKLAPSYEYQTRPESAVPWDKLPERNKRLMIHVCSLLLAAAPPVARERELRLTLTVLRATNLVKDGAGSRPMTKGERHVRDVCCNEFEKALAASGQEEAPRKPVYCLGRATIEKVATFGQLDTEHVAFVAADDLLHANVTFEQAGQEEGGK